MCDVSESGTPGGKRSAESSVFSVDTILPESATLKCMGHLFSTRTVKWKGNKGILRT